MKRFVFFLILGLTASSVSAVTVEDRARIPNNIIFFIGDGMGLNQIKLAENIANSILAKKLRIPYQTVALPYVETDGHIRYFLEIKGT